MKRSRDEQKLPIHDALSKLSSSSDQRPRRSGTTTRPNTILSSYLLVLGSLWLSYSSHHHTLVDAAEQLIFSKPSNLQTTPFLLSLQLKHQQLRGGDSQHHDNDKKDPTIHKNNNNDDNDDDDGEENLFRALRKDWLWATGALFRLNEHVLAEALRDATLSTKNPTNGRGGALSVKRRQRQRQPSKSKSSSSSATAATKLSSSGGSSSSNSDNENSNNNNNNNPNAPPLRSAFDTSRVSPFEQRLMVDDDKNATTTTTNDSNHNKTANAANSLWWANVWEQQVLDADSENNPKGGGIMEHPKQETTATATTTDNKNHNNNNKDLEPQHQQPAAGTNKKDDIPAIHTPAKEDNKDNNNNKNHGRHKDKTNVPIDSSSPPETAVTEPESTPSAPVATTVEVSPYASSGYWGAIDQVTSLGLASFHPAFRMSLRLRAARKATARMTGWHGVLSGKGRVPRPKPQKRLLLGASSQQRRRRQDEEMVIPLDEEDLGMIRRRIAAIDRARETLERAAAAEAAAKRQMRWTWLFGTSDDKELEERTADGGDDVSTKGGTEQSSVGGAVSGSVAETNQTAPLVAVKKSREEERLEEKRRKERAKEEEREEKRRQEKAKQDELEEKRRMEQAKEEEKEESRRREKVMAIDKQILEGQLKLQELQCEKDAIQRRPNPLWNYTTEKRGGEETHTRTFNFPPPELVEEYLEVLFWSGRLVKLNHTHLWKNAAEWEDDDDDETIGDDLLTPSADAYKLYEKSRRQSQQQQQRQQHQQQQQRHQRLPGDEYRRGNGGGGSWLLRQTIGKGGSLGEKIGETAETAAYKGVCQALMGVLARGLSLLHGVNILSYSDIRLFMEQSPDLPPLGGVLIPGSGVTGSNYAQQALKNVMRRGARKNKRRKQNRLTDNEGIQRDAIVETLLSHCQISAPLLKLFPLAWQRALLGNIITLVAAVVSDFCEGIQFQILGHQLSFLFKPITENDVIQHLSMPGHGFNHRRARPDQFEAAVRATAEEINGNLKFLDRWHERALGGGMLRAQIADLIARLVLTLFDEVLCGARMDLWSAQAGGPRLVAGLEYRTTTSYMDTQPSGN